jgi:hypothetical protein
MKAILSVLLFVLIGIGFTQCRKDVLITESSAMLAFSKDTVLFDTVFTSVGSTTDIFKIYNTHNQAINISNIELAGGFASNFRINVDGVSGVSHANVEIPAGDSLFVFVEVTVDPNGGNSPLIITDSLVFETNGNVQDVQLIAWGQDAYFHVSELIETNTVWSADKPHVIYNYTWVDSSQTLAIDAGAQIHCHAGATLFIYKSSLQVNGVVGNPVVFQGDRLEGFYASAPGQWRGLWFRRAKESYINHAVIKNAVIGIQMDTLNDDAGNAGLTITNCKIENHSAAGIFAQTGKIRGENLAITNCGQFAAALTIGGEYNFGHCTFSVHYEHGNRQDPVFLLNNYYESGGTQYVYPLENTRFDNCIFEGSNDEEFVIDMLTGSTQDYFFNHCLIKTESDVSNATNYASIFKNEEPGFVTPSGRDVHLDTDAYCIDRGDNTYLTITVDGLDLDGASRDASPDLGCYEY